MLAKIATYSQVSARPRTDLRAGCRAHVLALALRTGVGSLRSTRGRNGNHPIAQWRASSLAHCQRLVRIFDRYPLRAKKARDYEIWREAVVLLSGPRGAETEALLERLKGDRSYRGRSRGRAAPARAGARGAARAAAHRDGRGLGERAGTTAASRLDDYQATDYK